MNLYLDILDFSCDTLIIVSMFKIIYSEATFMNTIFGVPFDMKYELLMENSPILLRFPSPDPIIHGSNDRDIPY